ncbi:unnamed protein product [Arabis nemorensis]|uniref:Uncharacterized protein n=1 Tax=Arabis nemorensis TaxID=586526 RepID=A0A565BVZ2_9BRAS|nr:unnamed protein product [Arabis nemorensis]
MVLSLFLEGGLPLSESVFDSGSSSSSSIPSSFPAANLAARVTMSSCGFAEEECISACTFARASISSLETAQFVARCKASARVSSFWTVTLVSPKRLIAATSPILLGSVALTGSWPCQIVKIFFELVICLLSPPGILAGAYELDRMFAPGSGSSPPKGGGEVATGWKHTVLVLSGLSVVLLAKTDVPSHLALCVSHLGEGGGIFWAPPANVPATLDSRCVVPRGVNTGYVTVIGVYTERPVVPSDTWTREKSKDVRRGRLRAAVGDV